MKYKGMPKSKRGGSSVNGKFRRRQHGNWDIDSLMHSSKGLLPLSGATSSFFGLHLKCSWNRNMGRVKRGMLYKNSQIHTQKGPVVRSRKMEKGDGGDNKQNH